MPFWNNSMIMGGPLSESDPPALEDVFNISLWTGNLAARTITTGIDSGEGSLVWIKIRSSYINNFLYDTNRGAGYRISSDLTNAQILNVALLSGFTSTGYELGTNSSVNASGHTFVGWQFRRAPKFFDIVQYTGNGVSGRTIAHSLGVKPGVIIVKQFDVARSWPVYHHSLTATQYAYLNTTDAVFSGTEAWNSTEPTDAAFAVGSDQIVNLTGGTYIAYLFAHDPSPEGIIQCGSFTTNVGGSGSFTHGWDEGCQFLMLKCATASGDWEMFDTTRSPGWASDLRSRANLSTMEDSVTRVSNSGNTLSFTGLSASQTYTIMAIRGTE